MMKCYSGGGGGDGGGGGGPEEVEQWCWVVITIMMIEMAVVFESAGKYYEWRLLFVKNFMKF
jgi:hypothetical protein